MTLIGRLERYVLTRTLMGVGTAFAIIMAVILLVQFVDLSRSVGVRADVGVTQLFGLTLLKAPGIVILILPFVFLFGGMAAFVGLNRHSELVAMRAAGVSACVVVPVVVVVFANRAYRILQGELQGEKQGEPLVLAGRPRPHGGDEPERARSRPRLVRGAVRAPDVCGAAFDPVVLSAHLSTALSPGCD